jgi:hypothetical protein
MNLKSLLRKRNVRIIAALALLALGAVLAQEVVQEFHTEIEDIGKQEIDAQTKLAQVNVEIAQAQARRAEIEHTILALNTAAANGASIDTAPAAGKLSDHVQH